MFYSFNYEESSLLLFTAQLGETSEYDVIAPRSNIPLREKPIVTPPTRGSTLF